MSLLVRIRPSSGAQVSASAMAILMCGALAAAGQQVGASSTAGLHSPELAGDWDLQNAGAACAELGGPGGNFDWQIPSGTVVIFDTSQQLIVGGPDFLPTTTQLVLNGMVEVRNFHVEDGALLKLVGPRPVRIRATGFVQIDGEINADGGSSAGVIGLNTASIPELGAIGQAGGGAGGLGSPMIADHSTMGGQGFGAFGKPNAGGMGGEAGWSVSNVSSRRRGGGGGGGRLGADDLSSLSNFESVIGMNAEDGFDGNEFAFGAKDPEALTGPPKGGAAGSGPFEDADANNNFFGRRLDPFTGQVTSGELSRPTAGTGGGGGGDASRVTNPTGIYPDAFTPFGDEKGAGGGGGGGCVAVQAAGPLRFGPMGKISVRGGTGGGGESTNFVNRIGAGSGGGSGGQIILQAPEVDLSESLPGFLALDATGGQGGAGANDAGGAGITGETTAAQDACQDSSLGCLGLVEGAGGDGGPGVIQVHASLAGGEILLPGGAALSELSLPAPVLELVPFPFPQACEGVVADNRTRRSLLMERLRVRR